VCTLAQIGGIVLCFNGGLDSFLLKAKAENLSPRALELKRAIQKKVGKPVAVKKAS
jgi:large subunit ribosomal protein L28